ncbi:hypothetical protein SAMN05444064_10783 [Pseudomonas syringae]|uniref:hypothetical protein n=1 Tax=Pseudomonas syringae TaxID=317 RepID=UPI0008982999|nr:hypothetical protein [Pseudomonas syringae]SDW82445.1 hypothetical protein SAMN05444514_107156 [Pseudomonas syringae]SFL99055.1 hypothetical protein SAMN05444064_10783 [Pseudomonas syringae]
MNKDLSVRELSENEMSQIGGGMTVGEGVAAIGVVAAATALAPVTAVGAGAILVGVAAASAFDAYQTMAQ